MLKFRTMRVGAAPETGWTVRDDPRPERRRFAEQFAKELPTYDERTRTAGGITGLALVHDLRGDTSLFRSTQAC